MNLSRRGFIEAAVVSLPLKLPMPYGLDVVPYMPGLLPDQPVREVIAIGYTIDAFGSGARRLPALPNAAERASWGWVDSDIKSDLRNALAYLSKAMRGPHGRPDLVVIDGIGYGRDAPLPPPFGRG
jgi:hypothetical protein